MDWRCVAVVSLILPAVAQVTEIPVTRLKPDATLAVELERGALVDAEALWIPQRAARTVVRVHAGNSTADAPLALASAPCASIAAIGASVWTATCDAPGLSRIDPDRMNSSPAVPLPIPEPDGRLAVAGESLWVVTDAKGVVTRVDPVTAVPVAEVYVASEPFAVAAADEAIWITSATGVVTRVDARTNVVVEVIKVGPRPGPLAVGEGAVWVLNRGDGTISRIDEGTNKVVETIKVDAAVAEADLAVGEGAVWLSAPGLPLVRIDPRTNRVTHRFAGPGGGAIVIGHGAVWVSPQPGSTWRLDPKLVAAMRPD